MLPQQQVYQVTKTCSITNTPLVSYQNSQCNKKVLEEFKLQANQELMSTCKIEMTLDLHPRQKLSLYSVVQFQKLMSVDLHPRQKPSLYSVVQFQKCNVSEETSHLAAV